jgi:hypothetical protein
VDINAFLMLVYPFYVLLTLIACAALYFLAHFSKNATNRGVDARFLLLIAAIAVCGFFIRSQIVPQRHYVLYDEPSNIHIARNLVKDKYFGICLVSDNQSCEVVSSYSNPGGYHIMLALWFLLYGNSEKSAYVFSAFVGGLSIYAIGLLALCLFGSRAAGAYSSLLLCFLPMHLKYSAATSLNSVSFLFLTLFVLTGAKALKQRSKADLYLHLAVALFFVNIRGENILLVAAVYSALLLTSKLFGKPAPVRIKAANLVFAIFALAPICLMLFSIISSTKPGWSEPQSERAEAFVSHIGPNLAFWMSAYSPSILVVLSAVGLAALCAARKRATAAFLAFMFAVPLIGYSGYTLGPIAPYEDDRFSLIMYLPVVLSSSYVFVALLAVRPALFRNAAISFVLLLTTACYFDVYKCLIRETNPLVPCIRQAEDYIMSQNPDLPLLSWWGAETLAFNNASRTRYSMNRNISIEASNNENIFTLYNAAYLRGLNPLRRNPWEVVLSVPEEGLIIESNVYDFSEVNRVFGVNNHMQKGMSCIAGSKIISIYYYKKKWQQTESTSGESSILR